MHSEITSVDVKEKGGYPELTAIGWFRSRVLVGDHPIWASRTCQLVNFTVMTNETGAYAASQAFDERSLKVSELHTIQWACSRGRADSSVWQAGNPQGKPVIFL